MTTHEDIEHKRPILTLIGVLAQYSLVIWAGVLLFSRSPLLKMVRDGELMPSWLFLGPAIFLVLFLLVLVLQFLKQQTHKKSLGDFLPMLFGLTIIAMLFQSSFREYHARIVHIPLDISFLHDLSRSKDARIRALAILAAPRNNLSLEAFGSLIHQGLLDKDPLVQHAARMVIEDKLGIRLKNGDEGLFQAQELIRAGFPQALLMEKGVP